MVNNEEEGSADSLTEEDKTSRDESPVVRISDEEEEAKLESDIDDDLETEEGSVVGDKSNVDMEEVAELVRKQEIEIQLQNDKIISLQNTILELKKELEDRTNLKDSIIKTNGTEVEEDKAKESIENSKQDYIKEGKRIRY